MRPFVLLELLKRKASLKKRLNLWSIRKMLLKKTNKLSNIVELTEKVEELKN